MTSFDLIAVEEDETYRVTVVPKYGKTVTLYVQATGEVTVTRRAATRRSWYTDDKGQSRWGYAPTRSIIVPASWDVKASPASEGYITRHKSKEDAAIAATRRARRYGRMCSKPIRKASIHG